MARLMAIKQIIDGYFCITYFHYIGIMQHILNVLRKHLSLESVPTKRAEAMP